MYFALGEKIFDVSLISMVKFTASLGSWLMPQDMVGCGTIRGEHVQRFVQGTRTKVRTGNTYEGYTLG